MSCRIVGKILRKMKRFLLVIAGAVLIGNFSISWGIAQDRDEIERNIEVYFEELFIRLKKVAEQDPTIENFRKIMRPVVEETDGLFGATLIDPDFVIQQVYYPSHFLGRGYDLRKVKELKYFYKIMKQNPAPQLSEPGHGGIFQPRLISMRYPVIKDGKLRNIVSIMVRTKSFLKATGLDKCKAFRIICLGKLAEERGMLSENYKEITLELPSTEWVIQYER